jgi:hypothetical protein
MTKQAQKINQNSSPRGVPLPAPSFGTILKHSTLYLQDLTRQYQPAILKFETELHNLKVQKCLD